MSGPLSHLTVVELAGVGPGPFACMLLADMGAQVLRVDRPPAAGHGPLAQIMRNDGVMDRGRQSLSLNMKDPRAIEVVLKLVEHADILIEGYLNLPEATAEVLTEDGWLRTNDIGKMDERGYLYLLDRQKFMIITGAVNVFPSAVESVLSEHPAIQEVAVVGVPHPEWQEAVVAVVVPRPSHEGLTATDVISFCDGKLSRAETPKHVVFTEEVLKTLNGKQRKAEIRDWLLEAGSTHIPWTAHS